MLRGNGWGEKKAFQASVRRPDFLSIILVLILTDTWDPSRFLESQTDLEARLQKRLKIVAGLISGNQIRAMPLPY